MSRLSLVFSTRFRSALVRRGGAFLVAAALSLPSISGLHAQPAPEAAPVAPAAPAARTVTKPPTQPASCTVRVVHALRDGKEFDLQLEPLRPQLTRPPLSEWHQFKLLNQHALVLAAAVPSRFELPDGHHGLLTFEELVEAGGKQRLRVRLEILDGTARLLSTRLLMNNGATMLQAGIKHEKGLLVLGITCQLTS